MRRQCDIPEACEVFVDPFFRLVGAGGEEEAAAIGYSERSRLLFVVHMVRQEAIRIISARLATTEERKIYEYQ